MDIVTDLRQAIDPALWVRQNLEHSLGIDLDPVQETVLRSDAKQIILNIHRQWGKSLICALKGLHRAVYFPNSLILLLSPSLRQSGELFRKVSEHASEIEELPEKVEDSKLFLGFANGSRIVSLPGKESTVRGYSKVSLLIVDEAASVPDELYLAIRPMLAMSGGNLMLISSPRGQRGFFHETWLNGGDSWERYMVKGEECPRISSEYLEAERQSIPRRWFDQEWCCEFLSDVDSFFDADAIRSLFSEDLDPAFNESLVSKDVEVLDVT